jgi:DNA-nicking Smr family endonuclease
MASLADLKQLLAAAAQATADSTASAAGATQGAATESGTLSGVNAKPRTSAPIAPGSTRTAATTPAAAPGQTVSLKHALASSKHADADIPFAAAVADVTPLPPPNRARHTHRHVPPEPRQRQADEADALLASKYGDEPAPQAWDIGQELESEQTFLRAGLGPDVLTKLRRGHWAVQSELDLHGHVTTEAHDALADFLVEARAHHMRCVRVIHGKGLSSPGREPVLKGKVRRWLAQWDDVLAYVEAPQNAGGGGAVLVLLRGART